MRSRREATKATTAKLTLVKRPDVEDGFTFRFASEIAKPRAAVPMVFPQYGIGPGRPSLITGYAGTGKTMAILDALLSVAAGLPDCWGGALAVVRHGEVRHIDYEMGDPLLDDRFQRLAYARKVKLAKLGRKLGSCSMPRMYLSSDADEVEDALVRLLTGVVLCTIDNLAAATPHAPKGLNDASIRVYLDILTRVSLRTGCTIIVLTHDGKSTAKDGKSASLQRMRNSSAIADAAGNVLSITVHKGDLTIEQTKASLAVKGKPITVNFVDVGPDTFDPVNKINRKPGLAIRKVEGALTPEEREQGPSDRAVALARKAILAMLRKTKPAPNVRELLRLVKGGAAETKQALAELRESRIVVTKPGSRGAKFLYVAEDEGKDDQGASQAF